MNLPVVLNPLAERDIAEINGWYEDQRDGLGGEFLDELKLALGRIERLPLGFPKHHRSIRRAYIHRFPYGVFYRVDETQITVVAVYHSSRTHEVGKTGSEQIPTETFDRHQLVDVDRACHMTHRVRCATLVLGQ